MGKELKINILFCVLVAIEAIFCFTPLGSIPIGPVVATLSMMPVIITSLLFGKEGGAFMGGMFAIFSFVYWTFIMPAHPTAFLFTPFSQFSIYKGNMGSIAICFLPRILGGFLPALFLKRFGAYVASAIGSITNTILVLLFIFIFFKNEYELVMGKTIFSIIGLTLLINGLPECIVVTICCPLIYEKLGKVLRKLD